MVTASSSAVLRAYGAGVAPLWEATQTTAYAAVDVVNPSLTASHNDFTTPPFRDERNSNPFHHEFATTKLHRIS